MVRQFIRSAIRDCAVWMIGALWPRSRPATTTAITPEPWIGSASARRYAANGMTRDMPVSSSGSSMCWRTQATTRNTRMPTSSPPPAARRKSAVRPAARHPDGGGGQRGAQGHQGGGVVEQRLALEDGHDPAGQPDPAPDGGGRDRVGRGDDGADGEGDRPGDVGDQRVHHDADAEGGEGDQADAEQQDRAPVGVEVDQRGLHGGRVEQRGQQAEEHHVVPEVHLGHAREVRRHHADHDQQQGRREVELVRQRRERQDGDGQGHQRDSDLHPAIVSGWRAAGPLSLAGPPRAWGRPSRARRRRARRTPGRPGCAGGPRRSARGRSCRRR